MLNSQFVRRWIGIGLLVLLLGISSAALAETVELTFYHCCGQDYRNALYSDLLREFERSPSFTEMRLF